MANGNGNLARNIIIVTIGVVLAAGLAGVGAQFSWLREDVRAVADKLDDHLLEFREFKGSVKQ